MTAAPFSTAKQFTYGGTCIARTTVPRRYDLRMGSDHTNEVRLQRMMRSTAHVVDPSTKLLERTVRIVKDSQTLPRYGRQWPDSRIDQSIGAAGQAGNQ